VSEESVAAAMPPDDPARFAAAHRELVADPSIQFEMKPFTVPEIPGWLKWLIEVLASEPVKYLFWTALAIGALVILYFLLRSLAGARWPWGKKPQEELEAESWRPEEQAARSLLREADVLAGEGRFDEAARLLLFRSIEDIDQKRPQLVRPALTSRDIAGAPELPPGPRQAFNAIVMLVERSLFGGMRLAAGDWQSCRSAYEEFAFAEAWG
jgi:hypothetical protein